MIPPCTGPRDRKRRGDLETHKPDDKTRPPPIPGWPVEPEIFTFRRRKSVAKQPYLVRHPKMALVPGGEGPGKSIDAGNGGADDRDIAKVIIKAAAGSRVPAKLFTDKELKGQFKDRIFTFSNSMFKLCPIIYVNYMSHGL